MAAVWIRAFGRDAYLAQTHTFATVFVSSCAISFVLPKPMQGLMITRQKWFVSDRRLRWDQRLPTGWLNDIERENFRFILYEPVRFTHWYHTK